MITCFVSVQWVYELCQSFYIFSKYVMIDLTNRHGCIERGVQLPEKNGGKRVRLWIFFRSEKRVVPENVKRYVDKEEKQVGQREAGILFAVIIITSQRTAKEIIIYLRRGSTLLRIGWYCCWHGSVSGTSPSQKCIYAFMQLCNTYKQVDSFSAPRTPQRCS